MEESQEQRHCRRGGSSPGRCDDLALHEPDRAVDKAIALAIENDSDLRSNLLLIISGVGDTLAGVVFAARGGLDGAQFAWGAEFTPGGKHIAIGQRNEWPRTEPRGSEYRCGAQGRSYGRKVMEWFNQKTSIAGVQISNWMIVLGAIIVILIIYTSIH